MGLFVDVNKKVIMQVASNLLTSTNPEICGLRGKKKSPYPAMR
nr:MAG TPA: hypothetical protein [Caudoviricetes sp.]